MLRIRLRLPRGHSAYYRNLDLLHNALVNAWTTAGVSPDLVLGPSAHPWNFAPLGGRDRKANRVHTLVVSTPAPALSRHLSNLDPSDVCCARAKTAETIDFSGAEVLAEPDPIPPGEGAMGLLLLSPLAVRDRDSSEKRWCTDLNTLDLSAVINSRLSRLAGRDVQLRAEPDSLYLRANPKHSVLVQHKDFGNGKRSFVIGLSAPLVLAGKEEDLRLAWYAGIGEKTRSGFGCLGLLERGVGR